MPEDGKVVEQIDALGDQPFAVAGHRLQRTQHKRAGVVAARKSQHQIGAAVGQHEVVADGLGPIAECTPVCGVALDMQTHVARLVLNRNTQECMPALDHHAERIARVDHASGQPLGRPDQRIN